VRVLAALGAVLFAYLAVIPGALIGGTLDSACAGPACGYSPPVTVYLVVVFAAATLALAAAAATMAMYAARPSRAHERMVGVGLKASAVLIGLVPALGDRDPASGRRPGDGRGMRSRGAGWRRATANA
jgi:hypothetical protein